MERLDPRRQEWFQARPFRLADIDLVERLQAHVRLRIAVKQDGREIDLERFRRCAVGDVAAHDQNVADRRARRGARRAKLLSPTAIAQADEVCGSLAIGPLRRLTGRLPGPNLRLSPQPHRVRHELRPPALAIPDRRLGSGRPPGRRIVPSLHPRRVGSFPSITCHAVAPRSESVCARVRRPNPCSYSHRY